jgi:hypothetical protein
MYEDKMQGKKNIEVHQFFLYLSNLLKYLTDAPSADIKDTSFKQSNLLLLKFVTVASFF